jgi:uncharacterized protein YciI
MKHFILEATFRKNALAGSDLQTAIDAHLAYLKAGFDSGSFLVYGPKANREGGIIVIKSEDVEQFCQNDPLVIAGAQEYRITEFSPLHFKDAVKPWFDGEA